MTKNVCYVGTPFALLLYILKCDMKDIRHTLFFCCSSLRKDIVERIENRVFIDEKYYHKCSWRELALFNLTKYIKYPSLIYGNLYVQDHLGMCSNIVGNRNYTLIDDAPFSYTIAETIAFQPYKPNKGDTIKEKIAYFLSFGPSHGQFYGTSKQCTNRWVTDKRDIESKFIKGKTYEYISLEKCWANSSQEKKEYLKHIFNIPTDINNFASDSDAIILTQPMTIDCGLTEEEQINIYRPYIEKYKNVIIKPHPRDNVDYLKYFSNTIILKTPAPMQLLCLLGLNPKVAVTIFSTALSSLPDTTEKIYIGTKIHPNIVRIYGDLCN